MGNLYAKRQREKVEADNQTLMILSKICIAKNHVLINKLKCNLDNVIYVLILTIRHHKYKNPIVIFTSYDYEHPLNL